MMKDPYEVLGVSRDATDEQVKEAYRALARRYHPDAHPDNPLSELAEQKMQEINEAYDTIMKERREGPAQQRQYGGYGGYGAYGQSPHARPYRERKPKDSQFIDIRRMIQNNRITEAEELLDGTPRERRDAEWHFLRGTIYYNNGRLEDAYEHFSMAVQMDPSDAEYTATLSQMQWRRQTGRPGSYQNGPMVRSCGVCEVCTTLYCANCCCNCMGMSCR